MKIMNKRIVYTIGGFILMGISEIFKYYHLSRIFGKTGDLIGVVGLIAAVYGLWPVIKKKEKVNLTPDKIKKILFMRIDGKIGDYIISSFMFREIKKKCRRS